MIEITLENLDLISSDYAKAVIKSVLENRLFDKIQYTYAPKKKSYFEFVTYGSAYGYNDVTKIMAHLLTYHNICIASMGAKRESDFDNFFKDFLAQRFKNTQG